MNEGEFPKKESYGEEQITECLASKRVGFEEISVIILQELVRKAPQNEAFIVPDKNQETIYEDCANKTGRKDLKFIVESK